MKNYVLILMLLLTSCSIFKIETDQEKEIRYAMKEIFKNPKDLVSILNSICIAKEGTKIIEKMPVFYISYKHETENVVQRIVPFDEFIINSKKIVRVPDKKLIISGCQTWTFEYYIFNDEFFGDVELLTISRYLNSNNSWSFGAISIPF